MKRFFQIGQGENHVSCVENLDALECDAERLYQGMYFLKKFYERASQRGVEVFERACTNIQHRLPSWS